MSKEIYKDVSDWEEGANTLKFETETKGLPLLRVSIKAEADWRTKPETLSHYLTTEDALELMSALENYVHKYNQEAA